MVLLILTFSPWGYFFNRRRTWGICKHQAEHQNHICTLFKILIYKNILYKADLEECKGGPFELLCAFWRLDEPGETSFPDFKDKQRRWNSLEQKRDWRQEICNRAENRERSHQTYLYPLDHHELLHQWLHLPREVHCSLEHDESVDWWEGRLDGRLTLNAQHLRNTEPIKETFYYGVRCSALHTKPKILSSHLFTSITHSSSLLFSVWLDKMTRLSESFINACSMLPQEATQNKLWLTFIN